MTTEQYTLVVPSGGAIQSRAELRNGVVVEPQWRDITTAFESGEQVIYVLPGAVNVSMMPVVAAAEAGFSTLDEAQRIPDGDLRREIWPLLEPVPRPRTP
jgi:hypothetical protein